jgi:hypothetical protein
MYLDIQQLSKAPRLARPVLQITAMMKNSGAVMRADANMVPDANAITTCDVPVISPRDLRRIR